MQEQKTNGPLAGLKIVEMAGIGPAPLCGMLLADLGAEVIVVERPAALRSLNTGDALNRGKRSICLDLKTELGMRAVTALIEQADALIEGYRPGVMERLGLGPAVFEACNPKLVYGRVTGWGQSGPLAQAAGHDINYVALTGALSVASRAGQAPSLPATLLGDMAGGALFLALGLLSALLESQRSGRGQIIDAAMVDGVGCMSALIHSLRGSGMWPDAPQHNFFLHSSPFYDSFECADGRFVTLGAIEPQFYVEMLQRLDLQDVDPQAQFDTRQWPALRARVAACIKAKTQAEWQNLLEGTDVCFAPVLSLEEAASHPHNLARGNFSRINGKLQPNAAPRFSRSQLRPAQAGPQPGADTEAILRELGLAS
nr:CaiB/BaiF CoA-transferase family protein [uncultured Roseateles sp.]